jgi:hypothetical protein
LQADQHAGMILSMPVKSFYNGANKAILSGKIDSTIKGVDRKPDLHGQ